MRHAIATAGTSSLRSRATCASRRAHRLGSRRVGGLGPWLRAVFARAPRSIDRRARRVGADLPTRQVRRRYLPTRQRFGRDLPTRRVCWCCCAVASSRYVWLVYGLGGSTWLVGAATLVTTVCELPMLLRARDALARYGIARVLAAAAVAYAARLALYAFALTRATTWVVLLAEVLSRNAQCNAMSCYVMPCYVIPCHAMPCHGMSCHAMLCHEMWVVRLAEVRVMQS